MAWVSSRSWGGLVAGPGIVGSGVGHEDGLGFERVRLDSPGICSGGDVVQVILPAITGFFWLVDTAVSSANSLIFVRDLLGCL
jgi:hypothetical protein